MLRVRALLVLTDLADVEGRRVSVVSHAGVRVLSKNVHAAGIDVTKSAVPAVCAHGD